MTTIKKQYNYPKGYALFEGLLRTKELFKDMLLFISKSMEKFDGTYSARVGLNQRAILTQDPKFINHILREKHLNYRRSKLFSERATQFYGKGFLFLDGAPWQKQRRLLQPGFHRKKISNLFNNVLQTVNHFLATFPTGKNIDIYPLAHEAAFEMLVNSLFDMELAPTIKAELKEIYLHIEQFTFQDLNNPLAKLFYPITGKEKKALAQAKRLRAILLEIIKERKASKERTFDDLLDMLINTKYEDTGETMSEEKVIDELIVLIQAGHDTTATSIAWILYQIAKHPTVKQQLTDSLKAHTLEESTQNEYLTAVINESLRLFPTSWLVERTAMEDDQFEGYTYPKGTMIIGFYYGLHRDKKHWEDPLSFHPERFIQDPKLAKSKIFYPFGAGPRKCIGNHFAMAEIAFFIAALVKDYDLEWSGQVPKASPMATLRPDKVVLNIERKVEG